MKKKTGFTLDQLTTTIFHACAKLAGEPLSPSRFKALGL
jgi:hypothetical protein